MRESVRLRLFHARGRRIRLRLSLLRSRRRLCPRGRDGILSVWMNERRAEMEWREWDMDAGMAVGVSKERRAVVLSRFSRASSTALEDFQSHSLPLLLGSVFALWEVVGVQTPVVDCGRSRWSRRSNSCSMRTLFDCRRNLCNLQFCTGSIF